MTPSGPRLFGVNVLIAIADPAHVFHEPIHRWLEVHSAEAWATRPLTENGFVRVLSQPPYRGGTSVLTELLSDPGISSKVSKTLIDLLLVELQPGFWERAGALRSRVLTKPARRVSGMRSSPKRAWTPEFL